MQDTFDKEKNRGEVTFCIWNGVNEPVKRGKVLSHLKALKDVVGKNYKTNFLSHLLKLTLCYSRTT